MVIIKKKARQNHIQTANKPVNNVT